MSGTDSVALWLGALKAGRRGDAEGAWDRYVQRLVRLAGTRLPGPLRCASEGVPGDEFRRLLVWTAARRALVAFRHQAGQRGDGDQVPDQPAPPDGDRIAPLLSAEPTAEVAARFAEECQRLLDTLGDEALRRIASLTLQGRSATEIASALGTSPRTVERKRNVIRATWEQATT